MSLERLRDPTEDEQARLLKTIESLPINQLERTCRDRPWDSWKIIQERAMTCPILAHYCAAYKVFGPDARVSREMFLGDLVIALHDAMTKYREEVLRLRKEADKVSASELEA